MMPKVTTESTSRSGIAAKMRVVRKRSISDDPPLDRCKGAGAPLQSVHLSRSVGHGSVAEPRSTREGLGMQLVGRLLVGRHEHPLADDVVLSPVEHEDRGSRRDIGETLVD